MYRSRCTVAYAERLSRDSSIFAWLYFAYQAAAPRRASSSASVMVSIGSRCSMSSKLDEAPDATAADRSFGTHSPRFDARS